MNIYLNLANYGYLIVKKNIFHNSKQTKGFIIKCLFVICSYKGRWAARVEKVGLEILSGRGSLYTLWDQGIDFALNCVMAYGAKRTNDNNWIHNYFPLVSSFLKGLLTSPISTPGTHYLPWQFNFNVDHKPLVCCWVCGASSDRRLVNSNSEGDFSRGILLWGGERWYITLYITLDCHDLQQLL